MSETLMSEATQSDREAAVLDRIEAFRRRRPTLKDEVVTLAHGAGGKASAALVGDVFVSAFSADPGPLPDAATLSLASGERLAFSTDSFVVKPLRFPGGSIGHLAVHGTVNDLAMQGVDPHLAVGRIRHRGGVSGERAARGGRGHGRGRGGGGCLDRHRRHEGRRPGSS